MKVKLNFAVDPILVYFTVFFYPRKVVSVKHSAKIYAKMQNIK